MTTDKKLTIKRLVLFLLFAFVPPWAAQIIYFAVYGAKTDTPWYQIMMMLSMLFPMIANFLTRFITKEGFQNNLLKINFKGNVKYYVIAAVLPVICGILTAVLISLTTMPEGSFSDIIKNLDIWDILTSVIYIVPVSVISIFLGFGEEFGWRAYLTPKLETLMKSPAAIILSGIIWGLWHAPAIVIGHNFGTDYDFYPYGGILIMCLFCILIGFYFTTLTKKTSSVYPAAIAHIANNNITGIMINAILLLSPKYNDSTMSDISFNIIVTIVTCITVTVTSTLIIVLSKKK